MNSPTRDPALAAKLHAIIAEKEEQRLPKEIKMSKGSCATTFRGMLQLLRNSGYTMGTAVLEMIDNSIDASAKVIKVHIHSDDKITQRIVTTDFGNGMSSLKLQNGWQTAGDPKNDRAEDAIGKFLVGMKGATMSMCKRITIASREVGGSISCLHANVDAMFALNSFEPTEFVEDADMNHLYKYFHPADVDPFLDSRSGTMIQMDTFLPEAAAHIETTVSELSSSIALAYPHHGDVDIYIQSDDEPETKIDKKDVFYHNNPESIRFKYETELYIYEPDRIGGPLRVIEIPKETRNWYIKGKGGGRGCMVAGRAYEHIIRAKSKSIYTGSETIISPAELEKLKHKLKGVLKIRLVQVTEETWAKERTDSKDNKGFHMRRDIRNVGAGMRLGYKFHDRSSHAADRQRMEVTAKAELDKVMGYTWNKTMRDGPLTQKVVGDALMRIYKQMTFDWTKKTDEEIANQKSEEEFSEEEETSQESSEEEAYAEIPQPPAPKTFASIIRMDSSKIPTTPIPLSPMNNDPNTPQVPPIVLPPVTVLNSPNSPPSAPVENDEPAPEQVHVVIPAVDPDVDWFHSVLDRMRSVLERHPELRSLVQPPSQLSKTDS
jgi:hypothetical protein